MFGIFEFPLLFFFHKLLRESPGIVLSNHLKSGNYTNLTIFWVLFTFFFLFAAYSMGGAIAIQAAASGNMKSLVGLVAIDIVEGEIIVV